MPYFKWKGVTLQGEKIAGQWWARDIPTLTALLFRREVALLSAVPVQSWFVGPITSDHRTEFFVTLSSLLQSHLHVPEALAIAATYIRHPTLQDLIDTSAQELQKGKAIHEALESWRLYFDSLSVDMMIVGYQASMVSTAVSLIAQYHLRFQELRRKIKSALIMPVCTALFLLGAALFIFGIIVPQFETVFKSTHKPLGYSTRLLISFSYMVRSVNSWLILITVMIASGIVWWCVKRRPYVHYIQSVFLLRLPIIGSLIKQYSTASYFSTLSLMVKGGVPLATAVSLATGCVTNIVLKKYAVQIAHEVQQGILFEQACAKCQNDWFLPDVISVLAIAHKADSLGSCLEYLASTYYERIMERLTILTQLIQPALMIVLGIGVAVLLVGVYMPLFELPRIIQ